MWVSDSKPVSILFRVKLKTGLNEGGKAVKKTEKTQKYYLFIGGLSEFVNNVKTL